MYAYNRRPVAKGEYINCLAEARRSHGPRTSRCSRHLANLSVSVL